MRTFKIKHVLPVMTIVAVFFGGWASGFIHSDVRFPSEPDLHDPAFTQEAEPVNYNPGTFKKDVETLIKHGKYATAIALFDACPVDQQIHHGGKCGYIAIAGYAISLPGTNTYYEPDRDWVIPSTGCVIESRLWHRNAYRFAAKYNRRVDQLQFENGKN